MVNTNSVLSSILFSQTIDWNIKQFFSSTSINSSFELKRIGKAITRRKDQMVVEDDKRYKRITIKTNCGGVFVRDEVLGKDIKTKKQYYVKAGQLAVSKIDARNGAFGIVPPEADGAIITGNFWVYDVNPEIANIDYLILLLSSNVFVQAWQDCSNGSGNRLYLQEEKFLNYKIPMPEADVQKDLIRKYNTQLAEAKKDQDSIDNLQYQIEQYILKKLGISFKRSSFNGLIGTTYYKNLTRWDVALQTSCEKFSYNLQKRNGA
ncbi:MAG: restriction endonuclease subunit S [Oscillospiraceae bacterium]